MVSVDEDVDVQRYRLLETIRRFAQNKLSDHNEMQETRNDHLDYYGRLSKGARGDATMRRAPACPH